MINIDSPISSLKLTLRTENFLKEMEIDTLYKLKSYASESSNYNLIIKKAGRRSLNEIKDILSKYEYMFKNDSQIPQTTTINIKQPIDYISLDTPITVLGFSRRVMTCLEYAEIKNIYELKSKSDTDLLKIRNLGYGCLKEIKKVLSSLELNLKVHNSESEKEKLCEPFSLKDYFAGKIIQSIILRWGATEQLNEKEVYSELAKNAYKIADAMLEERRKNDNS